MATTKSTITARARSRLSGTWRSPRAMTGLVVALTVLLVVGLAAGGYFGQKVYQDREKSRARNAALSAARVTVTNYMTIDAKTASRDLKRVLRETTGDLRHDFKANMGRLKSAMVENKASTKADLLWAAVTSSDEKSATVLVAMDARVTNVNYPDGKKSHYRVRVTMAKQGDRWLASKIEFVG